ncbi:MAG: hypothetical protein HOE30_22135 [Deltaproteobacteria bacterium]|jgi:hypothetical protein|nr:hypothetical protein [Deltaproteobacteria bacterium]MBT4268843.1 hypothetical protein [Deltaproteobacteria bacterium]MBT4643383.1 hypothetical protein [Deltaproteobacteria bacterium]MBT6614168.1 hypothetical protein [Deltaproteobacteria bacterium]
MKNKLIDAITSEQALGILKNLAEKDRSIADQIEKEAERIFKKVDSEEICESVYWILDGIDVEELWDRSGSNRNGYSSPDDMSIQMMEELLDPFEEQMNKYIDLGFVEEAKQYCMGLLKGIYRYNQESESEFKNWASDVPGECFSYLFREWKKVTKNKRYQEEMSKFLKDNCSEWS